MTARRERPLQVIVVDDEPLAREGLILRLSWIKGIQVVAECGSADEAVDAIAKLDADVVFMDILLPGMDGFGVIERIDRGHLPVIIFVTAFDEYALRAFRIGAFDYLMKPYDDETLRGSVERARTFVALVRGGPSSPPDEPDDDTSIGAGKGTPPQVGTPAERLELRDRGRLIYVDPQEVGWVEAAGDHVRLHARDRVFTVRSTMGAMAARFDRARFIRIHRGALVDPALIRELQPYSRGEHLVVLHDGTKLPLSRRARAAVVQALRGR